MSASAKELLDLSGRSAIRELALMRAGRMLRSADGCGQLLNLVSHTLLLQRAVIDPTRLASCRGYPASGQVRVAVRVTSGEGSVVARID